MRAIAIVATVMFSLAVCGSQAEAHIPDKCTKLVNAASDAVARYNRATNIATDYAVPLITNPTSPTALGQYFEAAQRQAIAVGAVLKANEKLLVCIGAR